MNFLSRLFSFDLFSPSAAFTLPDQSILSPDASWISNELWATVSEEEREKFSRICPEFVIEVRSKSDTLSELKMKMDTWIRNGAILAWLIDPKRQIHWIYRPASAPVETTEMILMGEGPVQGFKLDLSLLF